MMRLTILLLLASIVTFAKEGMWRLDQLELLSLKQAGLDIPVQDIWNPDDGGLSKAVISLGGCTASFVSENGLIMTNHHCAYGALQRNSTPENNVLENGFIADTYDDELPTRGTHVYVLESFRDVTNEVLNGISEGMDGEKRQRRINENKNKLVKQVTEENPEYDAYIAAMYSGASYMLFISFEIKDVRIVYAPPKDIGKFGGDIDNFEWPRQTGDFSLLRAYIGPDGKPAQPSDDNVPFHPGKWLKVSTAGYKPGDFTMVLGYPGRTYRYRTSFSIDYLQSFYYPWRIELFESILDLIEQRSQENDTAAVKLASIESSLNNSLKNSRGQVDGFERTGLLRKKLDQEAEFIKRLSNDPELRDVVHVLPAIKTEYEDYKSIGPKLLWYRYYSYLSQMMGAAKTIYVWSKEKEKPEQEREPGYMDHEMERRKERWKYRHRNFDPEFEKAVFRHFVQIADELPWNAVIKTVEQLPSDVVDSLFARSELDNLASRLNYLNLSREEVLNLDDPLIQFAADLHEEMQSADDQYKAFQSAMSQWRPRYIEALAIDSLLYPDANSTKRLSFGKIKGYSPADGVKYLPFTTTDGLLEKYTGSYPFDIPGNALALIKRGRFGAYIDPVTKKLHVDFLSTLDTTGGNSGSPSLNSRGELTGLLFDGNYESIVADYIFDPALTRSICMDIRFALWYMDYVDHADHLIKEMDIIAPDTRH
ncbi:MAG: S46 family peptidase [candidate division KSB1 bacterium]|nr:S46 family peptidase [candidate division KSB1 bacterium]